MLVYRIEDAEGQGPFSSKNNGTVAYDTHHKCADCHSAGALPGPRCGRERGTELAALFDRCADYRSFVFGFHSKRSLLRWFRSAAGRRAMQARGLSLRVYDVDRAAVAKGNWQVAFKKAEASALGSLDLVTLKPLGEA